MTRRGRRGQARDRLRQERRRGARRRSTTTATTRWRSCCARRPVEQVREVAAAGETMPPKSTFFYPEGPDRHRVQSVWARSSDGADLHEEGRRRDHLALVRRASRQVRRAHRGLRLGRRGRARRWASPARSASADEAEVAADVLRIQNDLFIAGRRAGDRARGRRAAGGRRLAHHRRDGRLARRR